MSKEKKNTSKKMCRTVKMVVGMVQKIQPWFMPLCIFENLLASAIPYINLFLSAKIIDQVAETVQGKGAMEDAIQTALQFVCINMVLALMRWATNKVLIIMRRKISNGVLRQVAEKCLTMDYQVLEKAETLDTLKKAQEGSNGSGDMGNYCETLTGGMGRMISMIYGIGIFLPFLKSFSFSGMALLGLLCVLFLLQFLLFQTINQLQYKFYEENVKGNRRFASFFRFIYDYAVGKQVRIFHLSEIISDELKKYKEIQEKYQAKTAAYSSGVNALSQVLMGVGLLVSYFFIGYQAVQGHITIGELTLYVGAMTTFSTAVVGLFWTYSMLSIQGTYLSNYSDFMSLKNEKYDGTLPVEKRLDNDYELEFRNVSFHYPNNNQLVLKNISAKLRVGGKMAIVGKNGSGKSTFIKLLCRLYDPTEGEILLNGIDIRKYDYDEYRRLFGVVFQDFQLFSFPVAWNVAAQVDYDREKVEDALEKAGLLDRVKSMPKGIDTVIYKQEEEGVEISGGEAQKIAIARALYKDAPVVIMDEPTAALDPVSELEIYRRFDEMVEEKTAIYISHRMSSCRFCDNIVVFDEGNILEQGSHKELIDKDGLYAELWNAQAQYYI